jgi:hypothetical protein
MEPRATVVRTPGGTEGVVLDLADFQALLDAAHAASHGLPDVAAIVQRLSAVLGEHHDVVDLDRFLAEYDALHGKG